MSNFFLPAATLWQRELVRFWRQKSRVLGVVASPLVFWLLDRLRLQRPGALLFRRAGADRDVLRHLLHHLHHRRSPRRFPALHAGLARAPHQHGAGQDPGRRHAGLDSGPHLSGLRAAGRRRSHPPARAGSGGRRHFSDFLHAHRPGFCDRLENGVHLRLPRHHEPAAGAHVDGFRLAFPHGHRARMGESHHVGEPADLLDRPVEPPAPPPQRRPRRLRRAWWSPPHSAWCCCWPPASWPRRKPPTAPHESSILLTRCCCWPAAPRPSRCPCWARSRRSNSPLRPASPSTANLSTAMSGWPTSSTPPALVRAP